MAESQFSETQFVIGYLSEYLDELRSFYYPQPRFLLPSTSTEAAFGSDLIIKSLLGLDFIQFKRSKFVKVRRGSAEIKAGVPKDYRPYYKFKVYNQGKIPQFDRLRDIAKIPYCSVFYCAPMFHTYDEFFTHFDTNNIMNNSVRIDCSQFNDAKFNHPNFDINDGDTHYLVYRPSSPTGFMCSKRLEVNINEGRMTSVQEGQNEQVINSINRLYSYLKETNYKSKILADFPIETPSQKLQYVVNVLAIEYNVNTITY